MTLKRKARLKKEFTLVVNEFPKNTKEIYVCGNIDELGNWSCKKAMKMIPNEKNEFELVIRTNGIKKVQYKYMTKQDWNNVECGIVAQDIPTHSFMTNKNKIIIDSIRNFKET